MSRAQVKAVEIVLGMFILLVVSVVLIQLFKNFMGQQAGQLQDTMLEEKIRASKDRALESCNSQCSQASAASCSDLEMANFCLKKVGIDYNGNGRADSKEYGEIVGVYTCEDPVYCFQLTSCDRCGIPSGAEGARKCKQILCSYWSSIGLEGDSLNKMAASQIVPGECVNNPDLVNKTSTHWFSLAFGNLTVKCE